MQGAEMRRLRLTKLLILASFALVLNSGSSIADENHSPEARRIQRDVDGVTTVLLVPARPGKSIPPVGVLSKSARTFVHDGASTEYATQVLGTTIDNGRFYAKILQTSSRVFYNKDDGVSPYVVYPSSITEEQYNSKYHINTGPKSNEEAVSSPGKVELSLKEELNEKDNDIFHKDESGFKPTKVESDNLPTYTVKKDYYVKGSDIPLNDEQLKEMRSREPKIYRSPPKISSKKQEKPLATVTYHGFADFTTTVGDTVIVFSPSSSPAPAGRPATTIKGEPTLRPDDGIAVSKIKPTSVLSKEKKTETVPLRGQNSLHQLLKKNQKPLKKTNSPIDLQPSTGDFTESVSSSAEMTTPLLFTPEEKTGLIKVIDSTTVSKGTTTHYMSSIFGTYLGTNYAQIIHTASNVYFHPEESLRYSVDGNERGTTISDILFEQDTTTAPETTDDDLTTIKDIPTTEPTTENELGNYILPQQGRSIKGLIPKNQIPQKNSKNQNAENKVSIATRLLPSTVYRTFTYFTTFFIPQDSTTSTSVKSREVVSSEVTFLKELILPSSTQAANVKPTGLPKLNKIKASAPIVPIESTNVIEKQEEEEIQLIFKTIFTTFTYLTTFYDDSTTSVSSRKVTATNVITQTIDPNHSTINVNRIIPTDSAGLIAPTKVIPSSSIDLKTKLADSQNTIPSTTEESTTENILTTLPDLMSTTEESVTTEMTPESEELVNGDSNIPIEPSPITFGSATETPIEQHKTFFTTYTYFTTIIVDDETETETRTEVFSNVITETIDPTKVLPLVQKTDSLTTEKPAEVPAEIQAYLEALKKQKSHEEARHLARKVQQKVITTTEESTEASTEDYDSFTDETTSMDDLTTTENIIKNGNGSVLGSMKTDVVFTSSSGGSRVLDVAEKRIGLPDDQELSETNHHDVEPAPTLLLQTSYTTYTYFTTMYNGDATDVLSRLKTVTNVVTETIKPTAVVQPESKTQQPLTYFTTFTYWTTFIKGDETATTSREETVSNIVTPSATEAPSVQLDVVKTYRPFVAATPVYNANSDSRESKATSDNEVTSANAILKEIPTIKANELSASSTIASEPVTLYTTYTYFTTSYIGNSTLLNSRLETITSVSYPEDLVVRATPRAIGGAAPSVQIISTDKKQIEPTKTSDAPSTGLISTIRSSQVNDGTTTHFMTDVYGTYIDGLYAQVVETSTSVQQIAPVYSSSATPILPSGILSINRGSVVDADEITTVYFTTKQVGTTLNGLYVKMIESTSSTKIDEEKLATQKPAQGHRTGLVRLIKGSIEANDTTTHYQSKVIGTSIDGRYAQIIESTSSYTLPKPTPVYGISPSSTLPPNHASGIPEISPSPAVIQSSISDDHSEDPASNDPDQDGDDDEDGDKSSKKSRLTFSSRKKSASSSSTFPFRPFASRSRPTFNPKRKPQGATTITRSDITPTITATLAGGKGSRFTGSSRSRATPALSSSSISPSSSKRFSGGRRSSISSSSLSSTNYPAGSSRTRGPIRTSASSSFSQSRRGSSSIRGSSIRPTSRSSIPISSVQNTRYRPVPRPFSTQLKSSTPVKHDDQEDNANEFSTLVTEESPAQENSEDETVLPVTLTTTENPKRANNPLLRFRRPGEIGTGPQRAPQRSTTTTTTPAPKKNNNLSRQNGNNRVVNRTRPTVSPATTRARPSQSNLFPSRKPLIRRPETTEAPVVENKNENSEEDSLEDEAVEEIVDNDYEGSEQKEAAPPKVSTLNNQRQITPRPFTRIGRGRRVRRQTSQIRSASSRLRRPTSPQSYLEERIDSDYSSQEDFSKISSNNNARFGGRARSLSNSPRAYYNEKVDDRSSEDYVDTTPAPRARAPAKPTISRNPVRVKPSTPTSPSRQFTLREKDNTPPAKTNFKRPAAPSRSTNIRTRTSPRIRTGTNRYQDVTNNRRPSARTNVRTNSRTNNRRVVPTRGRLSNSHEDYRDFNDFDGTITVTHYVPTEVTIPVVNNGVTEKRNIITAAPSTEILGPDRYKTITNSDGRDQVVLASEMTRTNFQGQVEVTRFVIHETPTTKVSHVLTSAGGRKFSQPVVVPSTVYSIENIVSTKSPLSDNSPLANILLSQLLLGQLNQQNPLATGVVNTPAPTPTTRFDTRATTYVTTITKHQSTIVPLTFRGKEILTTLVDSTTDVVTATEFITDTVVITPTVALPAANINSLLLLLQKPQAPQVNPLLDPLFAAAPLLTQSNTLPGEVERRNQPVDFDYKPESYEDFSEEEIDKPSRAQAKSVPTKSNENSSEESSVITLYVSGRRPGEFSTVLSTVRAGDDSSSTKIKRDIAEATVIASISPSVQSASEPILLVGSEEPIDAHSPTQSLESVVGVVGRQISTSMLT